MSAAHVTRPLDLAGSAVGIAYRERCCRWGKSDPQRHANVVVGLRQMIGGETAVSRVCVTEGSSRTGLARTVPALLIVAGCSESSE